MAKMIKARPGRRLGVLAALAVTAVIGLAACGTAAARRGAQPAADSPARASGTAGRIGATLCAARGQVDEVVVSLVPGGRGETGAAQPGPVTIADAARVRALAAALCGLPTLPPGMMSCPADAGGGYLMVFNAPGREFLPVTAKTSGCRAVTGAGRPRPAGAAFWRALALALGGRLPSAAPAGPGQP